MTTNFWFAGDQWSVLGTVNGQEFVPMINVYKQPALSAEVLTQLTFGTVLTQQGPLLHSLNTTTNPIVSTSDVPSNNSYSGLPSNDLSTMGELLTARLCSVWIAHKSPSYSIGYSILVPDILDQNLHLPCP